MTEKVFIIFSQLNSNCKNEQLDNRDASRICQSRQLNLWEAPQSPEAKLFRQKPQIVSIPGVHPKERLRYRVTSGSQILGDRLSLDEALQVAKGGKP